MPDDFFNQLSDPANFQHPVNVTGQDKNLLFNQLESMLHIREAESCLATGKRDGFIGGPVHLGVGQEAVAVGVAGSLRKSDKVFGAHRSHSHVLAMGADVYRLFAEVLGKETGLSRGMGGSMHLWDKPNGFYGAVPIVSGTVSLAVGAGLAAKLQGSKDIGVSFLGDGAVEEGVVHESLNLARILNAPVLFVVENNLFASHMHISLRQPKASTARFAAANDLPYEIVDGNDAVAVHKAAAKLIANIREGRGPAFIEAITYRWYGHVDWREDIDVGVNRSSGDVSAWRKRDPIRRLADGMIQAGLCNDTFISELKSRTQQTISNAWQRALADPYPSSSALLTRVYASTGENRG